jgi:hypothetical protein
MAGLVLAAGALPLAFLVAVIAGGGHSTPFGHTPAEATLGGALLGVPALLLLLGLAIIRGSFTGRWKLAVAITIIIPVDAAVAALALWQVNRPEPPVSYSPPDPKAVIPGQPGDRRAQLYAGRRLHDGAAATDRVSTRGGEAPLAAT